MNFEQMPVGNTKKETINLYPERAFLRIDEEIDKIKKIESGEIKKIELSDSEKEEVLSFENGLGEKLEEIESIKVNSSAFFVDYFLTPEGKEAISSLTGLEASLETAEDVNRFFLKNRQILDGIDGKKLSELAGKSKIFSNEKLLDQLSKTIDENGDIDTSVVGSQDCINIILNPAEALEKIKKLRQLKKELKEESNLETNENIFLATEKIKELYKKKVNFLIADQTYSSVWASGLKKYLEDDALTEQEKELSCAISGTTESGEVFSRYDRFIHGADKNYDETGKRKQIGEELMRYANKVGDKLIKDDSKKELLIKEKGLNPEKIEKLNIPAEEFSKWAEELLASYGEMSEYPTEEYDQKRKAAAPDNKWQVVVREEFQSMSINSKQKVIKSGTKKKSIAGALGTLLGHEFTHFVQAENSKKIPLRFFGEKMTGLRSEALSEGGAVLIESDVCRELFGYEHNPKPHYIRAMAKKLEGGNYLDCVQTHYKSNIEGIKIKKENGQIDDEKFKKSLKAALKVSINSTRRLFKNGESLDDQNNYLTNSKDTVYAEQVAVMEKLRENGLEKCAFVKGVNLDTLATLMELGLINLGDIKKPNLDVIREIWNREKSKYELD